MITRFIIHDLSNSVKCRVKRRRNKKRGIAEKLRTGYLKNNTNSGWKMTEIVDALVKNGGLLSMTRPEVVSVGLSENAASMIFRFAVISSDGSACVSGGGSCFVECRYFSLAALYPLKDLSCKLSVKGSEYELSGIVNHETKQLSCAYAKDGKCLGKFSCADKHLSSWTFEHSDGRIFSMREHHDKILGIMPTPKSEIFINEKLFVEINEAHCESAEKYSPFLQITDGSVLGRLIDDDLFILVMLQHFAYSALHFRRTIVN